jgi:hypothetical protein
VTAATLTESSSTTSSTGAVRDDGKPRQEQNGGDEDDDVAAGLPQQGLRDDDVLTGRGSGPNQTVGNTRFRQVVFETYQEYLSSLTASSSEQPDGQQQEQQQQQQKGGDGGSGPPVGVARVTLDGTTKNMLSRQILAKIQARNGRFLRRICPEDYRNLSAEERVRVVRVPAAAETDDAVVTVAAAGNATSPAEPAATRRMNLYIELTPKETLEKVKQSLRFQVERKDQHDPQHRPGIGPHDRTTVSASSPTTHDTATSPSNRKRPAPALPRPFPSGSMAVGWGSPQPPPKKLAAASGGTNAWGGQHRPPSATEPSTAVVPSPFKLEQLDMIRKLFPGTLRTAAHSPPPPMTSSLFSNSNFTSEELLAAAISLQQKQQWEKQQQDQQQQNMASFMSASAVLQQMSQGSHHRLQDSSSLSAPPTPSSLGNSARLEALSRLLLQERIDSELAARIQRLQELKMVTSLMGQEQQRHANTTAAVAAASAAAAGPNQLQHSSLFDLSFMASPSSATRALLEASALSRAIENASPSSRGASLSGTMHAHSSGISDHLLRQLAQRQQAGNNNNGVAGGDGARNQRQLLPPMCPSLFPSLLAEIAAKESRNGSSTTNQGNT